jgi:hypothetical protein
MIAPRKTGLHHSAGKRDDPEKGIVQSALQHEKLKRRSARAAKARSQEKTEEMLEPTRKIRLNGIHPDRGRSFAISSYL